MKRLKVLLVAVNAKYIHSNLAVYSLKQYADTFISENESDMNVDIEIAEYTINNFCDDVVQDIYKKQADVIAFSVYIWNVEFVCRVASTLKKVLPNTAFWVGGPEVSYRAEQFIADNPYIDMVMCGEGEQIFSEAVCTYYREEKVAQVIQCKNVLDMNKLPFVYSDLSRFEHKIVYYETSRGCPFSCSYCLSSIDKKVRFRDLSLVKKELQFFIDNKVSLVKFVDRTFNCSHEHAMGIWKYIAENDNGITCYHFELSADLLTDEELSYIATLRKGLVQFEIGVQSFNEHTLSAINRSTNMIKLKEKVAKLREPRNLHLHLDLIAGLPYEDIESFAKSFDEVYGMGPDELQLGFLKVLSGSHMSEMENEYGIKRTDYSPYEVLSTKWLSYDDVLMLKQVEQVLEIFYNSNQFTATMKYLETFFISAFEMYKSIGKYYGSTFQVGISHSRVKLYEFLISYAETELEDINMAFLKELLTYDIYLRENCKTRPSFATKGADKTSDYVRAHTVPNRKLVHVESFAYDIIKYINEGTVCENRVLYLFQYDNRDAITYNANIIEISEIM